MDEDQGFNWVIYGWKIPIPTNLYVNLHAVVLCYIMKDCDIHEFFGTGFTRC